MNLGEMAFLYLAVAACAGALSFLMGQKTAGRTPAAVHACNETALQLESIARDLDSLRKLARERSVEEAGSEMDAAHRELREGIHALRRGADLLV